jgi:multidrug efflux pump subunit AcrA (membrane-fusion protein)
MTSDPRFSLRSDEFLPPVSRWMTVGGLLVLGMLGATGVLASVVRYDIIVKAPGRVRPQIELQVVQADRAGVVGGIEVKANQEVKQGDILAYLETPQNAQVRTLRSQRQTRLNSIQDYQTQLLSIGTQLDRLRQQILQQSGWQVPDELPSATNSDESVYIVARALEKLARSSPHEAGTLQSQWQDLLRQQDRLQRQLQQEQEALTLLEQQLEPASLRIPSPGKILRLHLRNVGQIVQVGDTLAEIVPTEPLVIRASVAEPDIGRVQVGQRVQLRVSAYAYTEYGLLDGTVDSIAPDAEIRPNGMAYYEVTIVPTKAFLTRQTQIYPLQPGMEVQAEITTEQETVMRLLLRKAKL